MDIYSQIKTHNASVSMKVLMESEVMGQTVYLLLLGSYDELCRASRHLWHRRI